MIIISLRYTSFGQTIECSIREQCRILEISRSHFYDWLKHYIEHAKKREIERKLDFRRVIVILTSCFLFHLLKTGRLLLSANNGYKWSFDFIARHLMKELGIYSAISR